MSITSPLFLLFTVITLALYYIVPQRFRFGVLLVASAVFYFSYSAFAIFVMLATALVVWFFALLIGKEKERLKKDTEGKEKEERKALKEASKRKQKTFVVLSVIVCIGQLFLYKYYPVLSGSINSSFGLKIWTAEGLFIPLGISYYSFQLISYITDVYRDICVSDKNPLRVMLFAYYFPAILQGPFNRYGNLMPQLISGGKDINADKIRSSVIRIAIGLVKKMCIADQAAIIANAVFGNSGTAGLSVLLGVACFAIQLYADFSSYMDIMIGVSGLFGITLPENFRQPFFSRNMSEFWQRWHITLGSWLKDYVFYPILKSSLFKKMGKGLCEKIGKNAGRKIPTYLGMIVLWTLIGAWHGAGFNYVFGVGILQFLYIFTGEITAPLTGKLKSVLHINDKSLPWHIFQSIRCTLLMGFAWIFFRAESFTAALDIIKRLFTPFTGSQVTTLFESGAVSGMLSSWLVFLAACIVFLFVGDILRERNEGFYIALSKKALPIRLVLVLGCIALVAVFGAWGDNYDAANFIYFKF